MPGTSHTAATASLSTPAATTLNTATNRSLTPPNASRTPPYTSRTPPNTSRTTHRAHDPQTIVINNLSHEEIVSTIDLLSAFDNVGIEVDYDNPAPHCSYPSRYYVYRTRTPRMPRSPPRYQPPPSYSPNLHDSPECPPPRYADLSPTLQSIQIRPADPPGRTYFLHRKPPSPIRKRQDGRVGPLSPKHGSSNSDDMLAPFGEERMKPRPQSPVRTNRSGILAPNRPDMELPLLKDEQFSDERPHIIEMNDEDRLSPLSIEDDTEERLLSYMRKAQKSTSLHI